MATKADLIAAIGGASTVVGNGTAQTLADALETALERMRFPADAPTTALRSRFWAEATASIE